MPDDEHKRIILDANDLTPEQLSEALQADQECEWEECPEPGTIVLSLSLVPEDSKVARPPMRVVACRRHARIAQVSRRFQLRYHPDQRLNI